MLSIYLSVEGQSLRVADKPDTLVMGSAGVLQCRFSFDSEWDGWRAVADFDGDAVPVIDGKCTVPESATGRQRFTVRVVGGKERARMTTRAVTINQKAI